MSHTDHARPPRVPLPGHRVSVRHVRLYSGLNWCQSACSCGLVGPIVSDWNVAQGDGRSHVDAEAAKLVAAR